MAQADLAQLAYLSHYCRTTKDNEENSTSNEARLETHIDVVERVTSLLYPIIPAHDKWACTIFEQSVKSMQDGLILPSGRALQFAKDPIERVHARMFNCLGTFACNTDVLYKSLHALLCGVGVGMSVQKHHVAQLPKLTPIGNDAQTIIYRIPDSIEGWALSLRVLLASYLIPTQEDENRMVCDSDYYGRRVIFDYSLIRPKGAPISQLLGTAPGSEHLRTSLELIRSLLDRIATSSNPNFRPIDVFDLMGHAANCVLAGGVRRSAMLMLFSEDDEEMASSKTGPWFSDNPQRARANVSALVLRDTFDESKARRFTKWAREFGEPGFILADDTEVVVNPCGEIGLYPVDPATGRVGAECCNLVTINVPQCNDDETFLRACEHAAVIGTLQSTFNKFDFWGPTTTHILARTRLLGISMTGIMENTAIGLNPTLLSRGAKLIRQTNERLANILNINPAARLTTIKPEGTSTVCLGLAGAGIHPAHAHRYMRRVQVQADDPIANFYQQHRPQSVSTSAWQVGDRVLTFPIALPETVRTKQNLSAIELLEATRLVQKHWVLPGDVPSRRPHGFHGTNNVSLTCHVNPDEWDDIARWIVEHRHDVVGLTLLANTGDVDYVQAPFERVYTIDELASEFGEAIAFASSLIVDLKNSGHSLHRVLSSIQYEREEKDENGNGKGRGNTDELSARDRVRRVSKFAEEFFDGDLSRAIHCLKRVDGLYVYRTLMREVAMYPVDWSNLRVPRKLHHDKQAVRVQEPACSGDSCELQRL